MVEVTGTNELTIKATAGEIYKITYDTSTAVDIFNFTAAEIFVNSSGTFETNGNVGNYLAIPDVGSYNGYRPSIQNNMTIYIKANAAGNISVVRKGY